MANVLLLVLAVAFACLLYVTGTADTACDLSGRIPCNFTDLRGNLLELTEAELRTNCRIGQETLQCVSDHVQRCGSATYAAFGDRVRDFVAQNAICNRSDLFDKYQTASSCAKSLVASRLSQAALKRCLEQTFSNITLPAIRHGIHPGQIVSNPIDSEQTFCRLADEFSACALQQIRQVCSPDQVDLMQQLIASARSNAPYCQVFAGFVLA